MALIEDNRNGLGKSVSVELQTESERQIGVNNEGVTRIVYFSNAPQIIIKTTYNVIGTKDDWEEYINNIDDSYSNIDTVPVGKFIESASIGGGWYIIDGVDYYGGSYVEADYSNLEINNPGEEFKIIETESANVSPAGYLPDGKSYYSSGISAKKFSRSSICTLEKSHTYEVGTINNNLRGGFITSKSISNPRLINNVMYIDLSLETAELESSISIF